MIANHRSTETLHMFKSCTFRQVEDTAAWAAIGLENRGWVKPGRSIRLSSARVAKPLYSNGKESWLRPSVLEVQILSGAPNGDMAELAKAPGCNPAVPNRFEVRPLMAPPKGSK